MRKRLIKAMTYAVILSLTLMPSMGFCQSVVQDPIEEGEELPVPNIAQVLGLSPKQKEQLKEQRYQDELKRIDTRNKIRLKELELRHELEKKEVNRQAINRVVEELKELRGAMLDQRVDSILKLKEILTPEQFEKLQSFDERRRQRALKRLRDKSPLWKKQQRSVEGD